MDQLHMTLRINREGEFTAWSETHNQCGKIGARHYRYFVTIEATNKALTSEGYVMENAWCDDYFQQTYTVQKTPCTSCEDMAQRAVEHLRTLFLTVPELRNVDVRRIYVRIHGSPVSFIEAEWRNATVV